MLPFFRTTVLLSNVFRAVRFSTSMETSPGTFLYFAYGSNLLRERIHIHNPSAVFKTIAKLQGYRLAFNHVFDENGGIDDEYWRGCAATIESSKQDYVWGVVWQMDNEHIKTLDMQEGVEQGFYKPITVDVMDTTETPLSCRTYQMLKGVAKKPLPSPQYLDVVVSGAYQNDLPRDYIEKLEAIEHNGNTKPVQVYEGMKKDGMALGKL